MITRFSSATVLTFTACFVAFSSCIAPAAAQDSKSAALAKELTALLEAKKLDAIAARTESGSDKYVAALYFPGQLLVVCARYAAPPVLNEKILRNEFKDVYIDLNAASIPESKILIADLGADGLRPKREANQPFDTQDTNGKGIRFDGNWREDKMSEADYMKAFSEAEGTYTAALEVLIGALKKGQTR
jgi:hypothetical protein